MELKDVKSPHHLSVVGVGHDAEVGLAQGQFIHVVEGADDPIAFGLAFGSASVVDVGMEPNGVFNALKDVQFDVLAGGVGGAVGFKQPREVRGVDVPNDGIPVADGVVVPEGEVVRVDLEL